MQLREIQSSERHSGIGSHTKTRQALAAVPVDRVFFETDESPLPIAATYATAAAITGKTVAEWKETVYDNYRRLFKTP